MPRLKREGLSLQQPTGVRPLSEHPSPAQNARTADSFSVQILQCAGADAAVLRIFREIDLLICYLPLSLQSSPRVHRRELWGTRAILTLKITGGLGILEAFDAWPRHKSSPWKKIEALWIETTLPSIHLGDLGLKCSHRTRYLTHVEVSSLQIFMARCSHRTNVLIDKDPRGAYPSTLLAAPAKRLLVIVRGSMSMPLSPTSSRGEGFE